MNMVESANTELASALGRIKLTCGKEFAMVAFVIPLNAQGQLEGCFISSTFRLDHNNTMPIIQSLLHAVAQPHTMVPNGQAVM